MGRSLYEELQGYNFEEVTEKTASEKGSLMSELSGIFSDAEIEALANEIDTVAGFSKVAGEEESIQNKVNPQDNSDEKKEPEKKEEEKSAEEGCGEVTTTPAASTGMSSQGPAVVPATTASNTEKPAQINASTTEDALKADAERTARSEELAGEILKVAYEIMDEKLAGVMSVNDYIMSKVADEDTATFIADKAEKLAALSDQSVFKVADDILDAMSEKINNR